MTNYELSTLYIKYYVNNHRLTKSITLLGVCLSLKDLDLFIKERRCGLSQAVEEGDYEGLVEVMGNLMKVKDRQAATDTMFHPLKETIEFLKEYGEELPDEVHAQLQASTHIQLLCSMGGYRLCLLNKLDGLVFAGPPRALEQREEVCPSGQAECCSSASTRSKHNSQEVSAV